MFHDIQWGEYQLIIDCGDDSGCSALSQWIHFPEPVSVSAHPSYSQLSERIVDLEAKLAAAVKNNVPPTILSEAPPKLPVSEVSPKPPVSEVSPKLPVSEVSPKLPVSEVSPKPPVSEVSPKPPVSEVSPKPPVSEVSPKPPVSEGDAVPPGPLDLPGETDPSETTPSIYITTHYLEYAVGGLIAVLVCGLLGYLIYHYRTMVGLVPL